MREWVHPRWPWCWPRRHDWNQYTMTARPKTWPRGTDTAEVTIVVCDRCGKVD
jgi:hypothetical protein